jgi:NAD(P)-dependent dehydrogenase (short-subunit alcohol dehydrogenase family)
VEVDLELKSKRAIVSGASRGIGLAIAKELAAEGVDVVITARGRSSLETAAKEIAALSGVRVIPLTVDTGDDDSVRSTFSTAIEELGGVDILVNCAADPTHPEGFQLLAEVTQEALFRDVNVKVMGYIRTAQAVAPHMIAQGWGRIINISGTGARQTVSIARSVRNVSVAALTKNLADELGAFGINVTVVHPGATRTEKIDSMLADRAAQSGVDIAEFERTSANNAIGRVVDAREVAWVVAFLASPKSVSISGDAITTSGGIKGFIYY